jgi:predicted transposase YdaD
MAGTIDTPRLKFEFRLVDIAELDGDQLLASGDVGDAMLGVLARVTDRRLAIRHVLERIAKLKERERELAFAQLMILSGLRGLEPKVRKEAKNMPFVIDLMENEFYREAFEKGYKRAEEQGRAKWRVEAELKILHGLLTHRFGRLPLWARKRLESATTRQLEAWSLKLLDAKKLEDVLGKPVATSRNGK